MENKCYFCILHISAQMVGQGKVGQMTEGLLSFRSEQPQLLSFALVHNLSETLSNFGSTRIAILPNLPVCLTENTHLWHTRSAGWYYYSKGPFLSELRCRIIAQRTTQHVMMMKCSAESKFVDRQAPFFFFFFFFCNRHRTNVQPILAPLVWFWIWSTLGFP